MISVPAEVVKNIKSVMENKISTKIPKQAKKVFSGVIFDVYQWEQEMFDGSFQTFEMLKRPNTTEIIATSNNKIILSRQSQPSKEDFYSLFGGRVEEGEDNLVAAKRELLEESGLESNNWELYNTYEPASKVDWQIFNYIAKDCRKVSNQNLDNGEKIEVIEVSFEDFIELAKHDEFSNKEFALELIKISLDKEKLNSFKKRLFYK
jgi:ADP-ribose pyrophosphatase YjhB (NUDIX family)